MPPASPDEFVPARAGQRDNAQPDIQASAALNNRIQAEHALLSAQQQQLAQLQLMAATQQQGDLLRAEEAQRQSAERYRDSLQPLGDN